nr:oligosaccharide flippase family protein [Clostridia bacterium]
MEGIKRRAKIRIPARASIWYIVSSAFAKSVGVVGTPIFTRLLSPAEYGVYPHYTTWFSLFAAIATLELSGSVIYRGLQQFSYKKAGFISAATGLSLCSILVFSLLYFTFSAIFGNFTGFGAGMMSLMLIHIALNSIVNIYTAGCRYEYKYKSVALSGGLVALCTPVLSFLLIRGLGFGGVGRVLSAAVVTGSVAIFFLYRIISHSRGLYNREIWRYLLKTALPLLPHYVSTALILRIGEIVLRRAHGNEALAKYSVAMSVGLSLTVITNGLLSALAPWMLRKIKSAELSVVRELLYSSLKGLSLICLLILTVVPETIGIIAPAAYSDALVAVYPLALSVIPMFLSGAVVSCEAYFERGAATSLPSLVTAALTLISTVIVIPRVDFRFSALFLLLSYLSLAGLNILLFRRLSGENPIPIRRSVALFLFTLVYAVGLLLLRESLVPRLLFALPLIPALVGVARNVLPIIREKST